MTIEVRLAPLDGAAGDALEARGLALLDEAERERVSRYRHTPSRRAFIVARGVLRTLLSELAPSTAPEAWRFETGERGKPIVPGGPSFNLSHTDGLVVVAASTASVNLGVDVEAIDRSSDLDKLAQRYFSPFEARAWMRRPHDERRDRFFDLWTLKESYMKATGLGFALGLSTFWFDLDARPLAFHADPGVDLAPERWAFRCWACGRHRISLCVDANAVVRHAWEGAGERPDAVLRHG